MRGRRKRLRGPLRVRRSGLSLTAGAVLASLLAGCSSLVATPEASKPDPSPPGANAEPSPAVSPVPLQPPSVQRRDPGVTPEPPNTPSRLDPILDSPWALTPEMDEQVQRWIESFQTREAELFRTTLSRMGQFEAMVSQELRQQGLPGSLLFLPVVESWYNPRAVSWVGAAGLWQFMPATARGMGLHVDRLIDERRDPFRSTPPALSFLADLYEQFGSWFLALAAYNGGPGRVERILRRYGQSEMAHDGVFLEILQSLPRETRNFVPRFLAAARIGMDPASYGFGGAVPQSPWRFDEVEVPDATSLDVVAEASQADQELLESLNPQLLRGLTPAGVPTRLRVPEGAGARFASAYARIPTEERVTFLEHTVAQGETLTHIARRYGVTVDDLRATNPRIQPRRMQIGQRVVVPKAPSVRARLSGDGEGRAVVARDRLVVYSVQSGDTLSAIAVRHRVGLNDLLRWNSLTMSSVIRPGDRVRIYLPSG